MAQQGMEEGRAAGPSRERREKEAGCSREEEEPCRAQQGRVAKQMGAAEHSRSVRRVKQLGAAVGSRAGRRGQQQGAGGQGGGEEEGCSRVGSSRMQQGLAGCSSARNRVGAAGAAGCSRAGWTGGVAWCMEERVRNRVQLGAAEQGGGAARHSRIGRRGSSRVL